MDKLKKIIILLFVMILLIGIGLLLVLNNKDMNITKGNEKEEIMESEQETEELNYSEVSVDDKLEPYDYFLAKNCINQYFGSLNRKSEDYLVRDESGAYKYQINEQDFKQNIYNLLDQNYISENNISVNNVLNYIHTIEEGQELTITEIKSLGNQEEIVYSYKVKGIIQKADYDRNKIGEGYYIISVDKANSTFAIMPINKEIYDKTTINAKISKAIKNNGFNIYVDPEVTSQLIAEEYFNKYKNLMLSSSEIVYEKMTEEYRQKRFGSLENLKKYLEDISQELKGTRAAKYLISENGKNTQYVLKDQYDNLYIFDEIGNMDATIKLDTYTLEEKTFNTTYSQSQPSKKVQMNIDKFFQMINRHDYRTSYSCLAQSFRSKNMQTQQDFEKIVKSKFFIYNKVEYVDFNEVGSSTYSYKIKLTDLKNEKQETKDVTIIMQLNEGTDFVMSFSLE